MLKQVTPGPRHSAVLNGLAAACPMPGAADIS